ncbi:amidohydrolase [Burkholderia sp. Ax-1724]|nr:amidohydrolase [Burkholderia sp. Ax-1724]
MSVNEQQETLIINANVLTLDANNTIAEAVLVRNGLIAAVGTNADVAALKHDGAVVIDAGGQTVLPGFVDAHSHVMFGGLVSEAVDLLGAESIDEIVDKVAKRALETPEGEWVRASGYDPDKLREKRHPGMADLDRASTRHKIWMSSDSFHSSTANTLGFEAIGIGKGTPGLEVDAAGNPTGAYAGDVAHVPARQKVFGFISDSDAERMIRLMADRAIERGITTIHAFEGSKMDGDRDIDIMMRIKDSLPVHIVPYYETFDIPRAQALGVHGVGGCGRSCLDGMPNTFGAALHSGYADCCSNHGVLLHAQDDINTLVSEACAAGLQVGVHAMGDAAIDQLLDAFENAEGIAQGRSRRHRIEHFHVPTTEQIERAANLGVVLSMQPVFTYLWGGTDGIFFERYGAERYKRIDTYKDILNAGVVVACGADLPVYPADPFLWLQLLVENPVDSRQSVSIEDALRMCISNGAWAAFEEEKKGSLEAGKFADLIVIDRNPLTCPPKDLRQINVTTTMKNGEVVYSVR